jgi:rhodanese-related sulfurtransferase
MLAAIARLFHRSPEPDWLDVATLRRRLAAEPAPLVLDVRGADEFTGPLGHIEGALNIPLPELTAHQAEIAAAGQPVVCVCLTDKRSAAAAAQLAASGLGDVAVLRGGMKAWRGEA